MNRWFTRPRRTAVLKIAAFLLLSPAAFGAERGFLLLARDANGIGTEVHKVRTLKRVGGFYLAENFNKATERFDAFYVPYTVDLASFEPANLQANEQISQAKAVYAKAEAAAKKYPKVATHLAPYLQHLQAELARAERGERKIDGKWLTAAEFAEVNEPKESSVRRGTLRLTNGTTYQDVEILSVNPQEMSIVHTNGAARVPMALVPEDFKRRYLKTAPAAGSK